MQIVSGWLARAQRVAAAVPETGQGLFASRTRRLAWIWVAVTAPVVALLGGLVHGAEAYVTWWVLVSGLYTTPALVAAWVMTRRNNDADRPFWRWWLVGTVTMYCVGVALLGFARFDTEALRILATVAAVAATLCYAAGLITLMRVFSGARAVMVDVVEAAMLTVGLVALGVPVLLEPIVTSDAAWFVVPAAFTGVALVSSLVWSLLLYRRLANESRAVERLGMLLAAIAVVDAGAQIAQGLSAFTLPSGPLLGLQAVCMGLVLLAPLCRTKQPPCGLDRLPPHAQVRTGSTVSLAAVALTAALLAEVVLVAGDVPWAAGFFAGVALVQLALAAVRFQLSSTETQRLYTRVRDAAEERRRLLTDVVQSVDHDRHRVAARLHEQATSTYVAFTSQARSQAGGALDGLRDELAGQADALRQLMLAIRPLEVVGPGPRRLTAPIAAYVDGLYGDHPTPTLIIDVDEELEADWVTETVGFRIVQEALRNVWAHAHADHVRVALGVEGSQVVVEVADDGRGFEPASMLYESGIATMRSFAGLTGGTLEIDAGPGRGTTVRAHLGNGPVVTPTAATGTAIPTAEPTRLRLVPTST